MGEEFYALLKLVSGEEIVSIVCIDENDGDPVVVLQNPIVMRLFQSEGTTFVKIKDWIEFSDDDFFIINRDKIITMTELTDKKIIDIYDNYIQEESYGIKSFSKNSRIGDTGMVKPSEKMGYISSVEDARKRLERIFKGFKES